MSRPPWYESKEPQRALDAIEGQVTYWGNGFGIIHHPFHHMAIHCAKVGGDGDATRFHFTTAVKKHRTLHWIEYQTTMPDTHVRSSLISECDYMSEQLDKQHSMNRSFIGVSFNITLSKLRDLLVDNE